MNFRHAFLILGTTLIASFPVHAALNITTYTDRALFDAAVADQHVETFDAQADGTFCQRPFPGFHAGMTGACNVNQRGLIHTFGPSGKTLRYQTNYTGYSMRISFDQPTNAVGFDWFNREKVDARVQLDVGHQAFTLGGGDSGFFGVVIHDGGAVPSISFRSISGSAGQTIKEFDLDNLAFADSDSALFKVTKDFTPDSTATVDVKLTCDTGHDREQEATIAGEDSEGVVFVLSDIPLQGADCTVTEGGKSGYGTSYSPNPCSWQNVQGGDPMYTCEITNRALPVTYGFTKVWFTGDDGGDGGIDVVRESNVGIQCTAVITSSTSGAYYSDSYNRKWVSKSTDGATDYYVKVTATGSTPYCWAWEDAQDSAIEVTKSGNCGRTAIRIGGSVRSCTITNTVFFEGIPTLSQYGLAIMALLMLGVGFVGFRRFV